MAIRCCHVGCDDEGYFQDRCEYEIEADRLARWVVLPYFSLYEGVDEGYARRMIEGILRCYRGVPPVG